MKTPPETAAGLTRSEREVLARVDKHKARRIADWLTEPQTRFMLNVCSESGCGRGGPGGAIVFRSCKSLGLCVEAKGPDLGVESTEFGRAVAVFLRMDDRNTT